MDGLQQIGLPILGIVAAAAATFYIVSFNELREKSLDRDWDDDTDNGGFRRSMSSRERRARRQAQKQNKQP